MKKEPRGPGIFQVIYMHLSSSNAINHETVFLLPFNLFSANAVDDEFKFNDASTHAGHLRQNGVLT